MVNLPINRKATKITEDNLTSDSLPNEIIDDASIEDERALITSLENANPSQSLSLLIIEDSPDVVTYLQSILAETYELFIARDGEEGIALAIERS